MTQSQTISYYKNSTRQTRFIKETGELLHIFNDTELSVTIQTVEESQRDTIITSLGANAEVSTVTEFNVALSSLKTRISNL